MVSSGSMRLVCEEVLRAESSILIPVCMSMVVLRVRPLAFIAAPMVTGSFVPKRICAE